MEPQRDFVEIVQQWAVRQGDKTALIHLREPRPEVGRSSLIYRELSLRAGRVGARLQRDAAAGDRVLLLHPPGLEFTVGLLGCLYAGMVAVPAPLPEADGRGVGRLAGIVADAAPSLVLTEGRCLSVSRWARTAGLLRCQSTDDPELPESPGWSPPVRHSPDDVALLQYTSGSTSEPKGVVITWGNLLHNERLISRALATGPDSVIVSWLPHYHDMGLIGGLQALFAGCTMGILSPVDFLKRPYRWLQAISELRATATMAPNFAFDLAIRRITDEQLAGLDLSCMTTMLNGAEPLHADTLDAFLARFGPAGLRPTALVPCYGLAEATLYVTGRAGQGVVSRGVDAAALHRDRLVEPPSGTSGCRLVSSGPVSGDPEVQIVDPASHKVLPDGAVGEIWLRGSSVAAGYWRQPELTAATFRAATVDGRTGFLRTGDLGAVLEGQLYVTGRIKEMLIVNGRNLYPQDLERAVAGLHPALLMASAFTIEATGGPVVLVQEVRSSQLGGILLPELAAAVRARIRAEFDLYLSRVVFVRPGTVSRTTSGKVQRRTMCQRFIDGGLSELTDERVPATGTVG
ncbi:MAG TPA: fatty acyl-AMP ligase [Pseudonocardiaceae bacterium]